jgi:hypothetical protein
LADIHNQELEAGVYAEFIGGQAPVQGWGKVDGFDWFFNARYNEWSFAVSLDHDVEAEKVNSTDARGFRVSGAHHPEVELLAASFMTPEDAADIILQSVDLFLLWRNEQDSN